MTTLCNRPALLYLIAALHAVFALSQAWSGDMRTALLSGFAAAAALSAVSDTVFLDNRVSDIFTCQSRDGDLDPPARAVNWLLLALTFLIAWFLTAIPAMHAT